jgi:ketosteroid isomerase-like protein
MIAGSAGIAAAADFDAKAEHAKFIAAFNSRQWDEVKSMLAADSVFHRSKGEQVYIGRDAVLGRFEKTIGAPDQWNVKFVHLDPQSEHTGKDGRVVTRGDFAVTAGADSSGCYAGSYLSTWKPQAGGGWQLQWLAWEDLESDPASCK